MSTKKQSSSLVRNVALGYIRLSYNPQGNESDSPERQRAYIQSEADKHGFQVEWFEDAQGHRSGRDVKNRPEWLRLEKRLADPDVAALMVYDLSRAHRKQWRIGELLERLDRLGVKFIQAAPGRNIDSSTQWGRYALNWMAQSDEYYAEDISRRTKVSIEYRKMKGITVGKAPFGVYRDEQTGFFKPHPEGVWLHPDGTYTEGIEGSPAPVEGAIWRGYFEAAKRALTLYADSTTTRKGYDSVADKLNLEGWKFRDRYGVPHAFKLDDVRRILANWVEYGGAVIGSRAKDRRNRDIDPDSVVLNPDRAVFEVNLLMSVGRTLKARARAAGCPDDGVRKTDFIYPLRKVVYCAHCDRLAEARNDPKLRHALGGAGGENKPRYRHSRESECGSLNKSVPTDVLEREFGRVVTFLAVKPDVASVMAEWFTQMNAPNTETENWRANIEAQIQTRRKGQANLVHLFKRGVIPQDEFDTEYDQHNREIARLQAQLGEPQQVQEMFRMTAQSIQSVGQNWEQTGPEERESFVRSLFDEVVYDLDTRRIISFKLKSWAEPFLQLRVTFEELYRQQNASDDVTTGVSRECIAMPLWGFEPQFWP
ncbi:MAG: recombinase family protein [Anaerolineae bacterium]|nr:recombinase family protein [Anaerolineae bacterium]